MITRDEINPDDIIIDTWLLPPRRGDGEGGAMSDWIDGAPSPEQVEAHAGHGKWGYWLCQHNGIMLIMLMMFQGKLAGFKGGARYFPVGVNGLPTDYAALLVVAETAQKWAKQQTERTDPWKPQDLLDAENELRAALKQLGKGEK